MYEDEIICFGSRLTIHAAQLIGAEIQNGRSQAHPSGISLQGAHA